MTREPRSNLERKLDGVERTLATQVELQDIVRQRITQLEEKTAATLDRITEKVSENADQIGRMTEHMTAIDIKLERLVDAISEQRKAIDGQRRAIDGHLKVAEQQSQNISELTRLVATQAQTVQILINRAG